MGLFAYLKKNRIKILKILIAIGVLYFSACVILQMISILFTDIYNIITLTYILILILCNFVVEFSPYFLNNYLVFIFPFLSHYSGRGAMYILIGIAAISPELDKLLNFGGYALIAIGLLCLYINWLIVKNFKLEYQDFEVMKDNYQDFNDEGQKDSLTFPKFITNYDNISERNSINGNEKENNINNEIESNIIINNYKKNDNEIMTENISKLKDSKENEEQLNNLKSENYRLYAQLNDMKNKKNKGFESIKKENEQLFKDDKKKSDTMKVYEQLLNEREMNAQEKLLNNYLKEIKKLNEEIIFLKSINSYPKNKDMNLLKQKNNLSNEEIANNKNNPKMNLMLIIIFYVVINIEMLWFYMMKKK